MNDHPLNEDDDECELFCEQFTSYDEPVIEEGCDEMIAEIIDAHYIDDNTVHVPELGYMSQEELNKVIHTREVLKRAELEQKKKERDILEQAKSVLNQYKSLKAEFDKLNIDHYRLLNDYQYLTQVNAELLKRLGKSTPKNISYEYME